MEERFLVPSSLLPANPVASWYDLTYHSPSPNRLILLFTNPSSPFTISNPRRDYHRPRPRRRRHHPLPSPLPQRTRIKNGRATKILSFCATRLLQLAVAPRRIKRVGKPKNLQSPTPRSRAFCVFFRRNPQESPSEVRAVLDPGRAP